MSGTFLPIEFSGPNLFVIVKTRDSGALAEVGLEQECDLHSRDYSTLHPVPSVQCKAGHKRLQVTSYNSEQGLCIMIGKELAVLKAKASRVLFYFKGELTSVFRVMIANKAC